jgi:hypothetical protein
MKKLVLAAAILLLACNPALAALGIDFSTAGGLTLGTSDYSLGWSFSVSSNTTIGALGAFDLNQDGFAQDQQVGLWDAAQNLLASVYVSNADPLTGSWRFHSIGPVTLTPGNTYYVASQGGEGYIYAVAGVTAPGVTYLNDNWHFNGNSANNPLAFPDSFDNYLLSSAGYFGGNFMTTAPLPGSLLLLGSGLLGLAGWRRFRS